MRRGLLDCRHGRPLGHFWLALLSGALSTLLRCRCLACKIGRAVRFLSPSALRLIHLRPIGVFSRCGPFLRLLWGLDVTGSLAATRAGAFWGRPRPCSRPSQARFLHVFNWVIAVVKLFFVRVRNFCWRRFFVIEAFWSFMCISVPCTLCFVVTIFKSL